MIIEVDDEPLAIPFPILRCFRELNHLPSDYGEDNKLDNFGTIVQETTHFKV